MGELRLFFKHRDARIVTDKSKPTAPKEKNGGAEVNSCVVPCPLVEDGSNAEIDKIKKWTMLTVTAILLSTVTTLAKMANSQTHENIIEDNAMQPSSTTQCKFENGKGIQVFRHRRGFLAYALTPEGGGVLMLNAEAISEIRSIRLAKELVLEFRGPPPLNVDLESDKWVVRGVYKFGGPILQFESQEMKGVIKLTDVQEGGSCHGTLNLVFSNPTTNKTDSGQAILNIQF